MFDIAKITKSGDLSPKNGVAQLVEQSAKQMRRRFESAHRSQSNFTDMKAIIQTVKRTYRTTESVTHGSREYETVKKIDAKTRDTTILGVPVLTTFAIDGEEKVVKFLGIPIKSFRQELWDHRVK